MTPGCELNIHHPAVRLPPAPLKSPAGWVRHFAPCRFILIRGAARDDLILVVYRGYRRAVRRRSGLVLPAKQGRGW
jgi:hypothetical protein